MGIHERLDLPVTVHSLRTRLKLVKASIQAKLRESRRASGTLACQETERIRLVEELLLLERETEKEEKRVAEEKEKLEHDKESSGKQIRESALKTIESGAKRQSGKSQLDQFLTALTDSSREQKEKELALQEQTLAVKRRKIESDKEIQLRALQIQETNAAAAIQTMELMKEMMKQLRK
ncbi:hypothetical protein BBJ28_00025974 [Nothophytophthora sp. Chile5]|nr:hypothetical protein BBJ28_00025974 [Nothophytophthora sp. Chile5]